jgi:YD repeat-containing protein
MQLQGLFETERQIYTKSGGTLLGTLYTCYGTSGASAPSPPCNSTALTGPITQLAKTWSWPSGLESRTVTNYDWNSTTGVTYGLLLETDQYDFGNGSPGSLLRKTTNSYTGCGVTNSYILDRICSTKIYDSASQKAETDYTYGSTTGNLLTESRSTGATPPSLSRTFTYNANGVVETATDWLNNTNQEISITAYECGANNTAFPSTITRGGLTSTLTWDCNSGLITQVKDPNGQSTGKVWTYGYDEFSRPTSVGSPDGGQTATTYNDVQGAFNLVTQVLVSSGVNHQTQETLDSLGRVTEFQDISASTEEDTTYDSLGRVASVSNPYFTAYPTSAKTLYSYDALNRLQGSSAITRPDGNTVGVTYSANCATIADESGKQRTICTDGLGRPTSVKEDPSGLNYTTTYTYNAFNGLTNVSQGSQPRSYTYDWLGRLTSASTPESGSTHYCYTTTSPCVTPDPGSTLCSGDLGSPCTRTDARGTSTNYAYNDKLNRLTGKTYSDGTPPAVFAYDQTSVTLGKWSSGALTNTQGLLTSATTTTGGTLQTGVAYSYDPVGRVSTYYQCPPANCGTGIILPTATNYDLAGDITSWTFGYTITNSISAAQQVTGITSSLSDSGHPATLAQNITYTPWGALSTLTNGCVGTGCTNLQETYDYNNRMQPVRFQLGTSASPSADYCLVYNYYQGVANPTTCTNSPTQATTGNNGNVVGLYDLDGPNNTTMSRTEAYTYDHVNRLTTAASTGNAAYNLNFIYTADGSNGNYGNMTCTTNGQTQGYCPNYTFSASTNQISGFTYDQAGNVLSDGSHTYSWDAEGRLATMDGGSTETITYNALGQRVNSRGGSTTYNAAGERTSSAGYNFVPWGGVNWAVYTSSTYFVHHNLLQSATIATNQTGAVSQDLAFYPWGQNWIEHNGSQDNTFATMVPLEQASGADIFTTLNRDYDATNGRWLSPDPLAGDVTNPQSLNLELIRK